MRMLTLFFSIGHGVTAVSLRKPAAESRSRRSKQLSAACACFQSDVRCKQRWPGRNKSFCGGAIANRWHPKDKHQNGTCVQCDLHRFLWSLADPRRKHAEKRKPFALFSNASLISDPPELLNLRLLLNKPPSDLDCLDGLHTGRSEQEPTLSGVLYTVVCWLWQPNLTAGSQRGVGEGDCDTTAGLSQSGFSPTTAATYSCQRIGRPWGKTCCAKELSETLLCREESTSVVL